MNVTFLIGNGFDINCGLKCRYADVYETYLKEKSLIPIVDQFKNSIGADFDAWSDFEVGMSKYMKSFTREEDFLDCVRDFKRHLNKHLEYECGRFTDRLAVSPSIQNAMTEEMRHSLQTFYEGINHDISRDFRSRLNNHKNYTFINYNYTPVLDSIARSTVPSKIIHIHGQLNDDIVLGMDNENQLEGIKISLSRKVKRAFIKSKFNEEYDSYRVEEAKEAIQNSDVICVYGMSLGISDLMWKKLLIDWLDNSMENHLFVYQYRHSLQSFDTKDEQLDYEEAAKDQILNDFNVEQPAYDRIFPRIHIPCGKNIFNIDSVIDRTTKAVVASENKRKEEAELRELQKKLNERGKSHMRALG